MICYRCGREVPDKSKSCRGCGTQLRRPKKVRTAPLGDVLAENVSLGRRTCAAWQLLACLAAVCVLLVGGLYLVPPLLDKVELPHIEFEDPHHEEDLSKQLIDRVTGTVIQCSVPIPDLTVEEECAYYDGTWQKDCVMPDQTRMRFARFAASDNWINTHIFSLYPDVTAVDQFTEEIIISGYNADRIQFGSDQAPGCDIQALCVSDGSFDYMFILETPVLIMEENEIFIDEWFGHLILADAQTGIESYNPAAMPEVSSVDATVVL